MKAISTVSQVSCPIPTCSGYIIVKFSKALDHSIRVEGKCDRCSHEVDIEAVCQAAQDTIECYEI